MDKSTDLVCLGELLIDFMAQAHCESLESVKGFTKAAGGAPANVAVGASKLGARSAFAGCVGDEPMGSFLATTLEAEGVDLTALERSAEHLTALAFVSISNVGERDFCFFRQESADMHLPFGDTQKAAIARSRLFHFGSFTLSAPVSRANTLEALAFAEEQGLLISFDPNIRETVWADLETCRREILPLIGRAHVLKVSEEEAYFLSGECVLAEAASKLASIGPSIVIVTLGRDGCLMCTTHQSLRVPNFNYKAVDATGAGDGFWSGFLFGLLRIVQTAQELPEIPSKTLRMLGVLGNASGTLATQGYGAIPSLPDLEQLATFLRRELDPSSALAGELGIAFADLQPLLVPAKASTIASSLPNTPL